MSEERVLERLRERDGSVKTTRSGRGLAAVAVLLALGGLGLAGYPYYQKMVHGTTPNVTLDNALATQSGDTVDLRHALDSAVASLDDRLQQQQLRQSTRLEELDARIAASAHSPADDTATAVSTARLGNAFKLAEAQYLLQGANDRLVLMGDGAGALALMLAAQQVLTDVDAPAVLSVRAKLNDEIATLRGDPGVDVNATFVRLEKLKQNLPESPALGAGFAATNLPAPAGDVPISVWQQVVRKFMSLFEFRRNKTAGQRPLTLDDVDHLRLSLELLLQTAQLALLRDDALVYAESLTAARASLDAYRANNGDKVASAQAEIDQLLAIPLHRMLPDVSGSLTELRGVIGVVMPKPAPQPAAALQAGATDRSPAPSAPQ
jgi:uroporphyrin-3 C-methyltransferase